MCVHINNVCQSLLYICSYVKLLKSFSVILFYGIRAIKTQMTGSTTSSSTSTPTNSSISNVLTGNTSNTLSSFLNPHNIVTVKLNRDNFLLWKAQIIPYMRGQRIFGFLDGTTTPPPQAIPNPDTTSNITSIENPEFLTWLQQDQLIMSTLLSSLTEGILTQVVGCTTSRDLWLALERMFTAQSRARIMQMHYQLATTKKGGSSIFDIFKNLRV